MTSLRENIKKSLDDNLKKRDNIATATLRLILAAVKDSDIENRSKKKGDTISDEQILLLLQNMVKQRKESADIYLSQNRPELAKIETDQADIIKQFLPEQLTEIEIEKIVSEIISKINASGMKDMGKVMGLATKELSGKADGKTISQIVRKNLS